MTRGRRLHRKEAKRQKQIIVFSLLAVLLCLTVGYAAFSTNIDMSAKGNINTTPDSCFTVSDNGDGTGTITDYDADTCGIKVKIPSKINNLTITKIGDLPDTTTTKLFSRKNLKTLIFPKTLIYIGNSCCIGLDNANINIPNNVRYIGHHAFSWGSMKSISLPEGLETIGGGAFESNDLTSLHIPSTVKNMYSTIASSNLIEGDAAFIYAKDENGKVDNTYLTSFGDRTRKDVVIPDNVEIIGSASFVTNNGIETIIVPNSVKTIKVSAFWSMYNLKEINIGSGVVNIDANAFNAVPNLTTININKSENAISGSPWGATNATVNWTGTT